MLVHSTQDVEDGTVSVIVLFTVLCSCVTDCDF